MASPTLQFKRGLFVNLPGLRAGEPGFTTDKYDLYVGLSSSTETNQFFGSARYWTRENGTDAAQFKLVDKDGTSGVSLRAPATVSTPVTYTLPQGGGTTGHFLKLGSAGVLEWASVTSGASFDGVTISNSTFTGISTFSGLIEADGGIDVTGHAEFDDINVSGVGTIATADINGGNIDGTVIGASSAAAGTFTELAYDNSTTSGISTVGELYIGTTQVLYDNGGLITLAGIQTVDATTIATLEDLLSLDPNDFDTLNVTGIGTIGGLLDANGGLDVTGHSELDNVNVSGVSTFSGTLNSTSLIAATNLTASGISTFNTLEVTENTTLGTGSGDVLTVNATSTFNADATFLGTLTGTISTATRATTVDTTATATNASFYIPFVTNSSSTTGEVIRVDAGISYNPDSNTLDVANVETGAVKAQDGTAAITISNTTGNVGISSNLTVTGDLIVNGATTTIETETLLVKDSLIEVGLVDNGSGGLIAPSSDANIDVGMVFHYYTDSAKKAAVYWDDSEGKIAFASEVSETNSVLTATTYATILAGGLEINNTCTGGTDTVISCVNSELALSNIVVDGGSF